MSDDEMEFGEAEPRPAKFDGAAAPEESAQAPPATGADLAREAMDRARASARQRGARLSSPRAAKREKDAKRRASRPYGEGRDPMPMSDAVRTMLSRMGWAEQVEIASVTARWREVVGDTIADHCEVLGFDDGVLAVRASSTAWATQLTLMKGQLRHRVNEEFGREIVRDITIAGPTARTWTKGPRTVKGRGPRDTYG